MCAVLAFPENSKIKYSLTLQFINHNGEIKIYEEQLTYIVIIVKNRYLSVL